VRGRAGQRGLASDVRGSAAYREAVHVERGHAASYRINLVLLGLIGGERAGERDHRDCRSGDSR
jgi:hypothetical protein